MDRERLNRLLEDPSQVNEGDLEALRSMADRFPWFSGAHLLLAVGQHGTSDLLANDPNHAPAAFLPSRAVLYDLTHKESAPLPAPLRVVKDLPLPEAPHPTPQPEAHAAEPVAAPEAVPGSDALPRDHAAPIPVDPPPPAPEPEQKEAISPAAPTQEQPERDLLDRLFVEAIRTQEYDLSQLPAKPPPPEPAPEPIPGPTVAQGTGTEPFGKADQTSEETATAAPQRMSLADWLAQGPTLPPQPPKDRGTSAPKAVEPGNAPPAPPTAKPAQSQREIMDRFIGQSTPAVPTAKAAFFTPQQAAKRSLQDDGLVSETLARIHEKQGNFAKAREVYDRLAAKHPEKSIYFAALSKALEARMNK